MTDLTRDELVTEAAKLGITVPKSWSKAKIETAVVEARQKLDVGTSGPATFDQPDPLHDLANPPVDMRRFIAEDKASHLGIIYGPEWSTEQLEQAIVTMTEAIAMAPPPPDDGWDVFEEGASPRG